MPSSLHHPQQILLCVLAHYFRFFPGGLFFLCGWMGGSRVLLVLGYRSRQETEALHCRKGWRHFRPQPGCHLPNSHWAGIISNCSKVTLQRYFSVVKKGLNVHQLMGAGRRRNVLRPNFPQPNSPITKHPTTKRPNGPACTEQSPLRTGQ